METQLLSNTRFLGLKAECLDRLRRVSTTYLFSSNKAKLHPILRRKIDNNTLCLLAECRTRSGLCEICFDGVRYIAHVRGKNGRFIF